MSILEPFIEVPWLGFLAVTVFGLLVGSFLNVVIHRLPIMMEREWQQEAAAIVEQQRTDFAEVAAPSNQAPDGKLAAPYNLLTPASTCPQCGHKIRSWENIPVISWLFLGGKCSNCKTPISFRYPFVELLTGALAGLAAWHFGASWALAGVLAFSFALVALTFIDFDTQLLPDAITLPLLWLGLLLNIRGTFVPLQDAVIGAAAGYLILWSIYWLFKLVTGKEGMGYGDFKLLGAIGAWLGWTALPAVVLLSSVVGLVAAVSLMLFKGHQRSQPIPFGPYLAVAGMLALYLKPMLGSILNPAVIPR
jgi:leader peptidase (prepilin peptidase) / N-methyltransferase